MWAVIITEDFPEVIEQGQEGLAQVAEETQGGP